MSKIKLSPEELRDLQAQFSELIARVQTISSGGYVDDELFFESRGATAQSMEKLLQVLVESAGQMETIVAKTDQFFTQVIEGFTTTDIENANKMLSDE